MQDGAPPHDLFRARAHLNRQFPGRWFGVYGPYCWPPRSFNLTPMDFFLWGYIKDQIYVDPLKNPEDLVAHLHAASLEKGYFYSSAGSKCPSSLTMQAWTRRRTSMRTRCNISETASEHTTALHTQPPSTLIAYIN